MSARKTPETDAQFVAVEMPKPQPLGIALTEEEYELLNNNIDGLRPLIHDAAETMEFIALSLTYHGSSDDNPGALSALRLAARGLQAQDVPEFKALDMLEMKLRFARFHANGGVVK